MEQAYSKDYLSLSVNFTAQFRTKRGLLFSPGTLPSTLLKQAVNCVLEDQGFQVDSPIAKGAYKTAEA